MADYDLMSADEIACVKKLAEWYERGDTWVAIGQPGQPIDPLELPAERRLAILGVMEEMGLLTSVQHIRARYDSFHITPKVIQVARAIHEQETKKEEPRDIVEQLQKKARSSPFLAWALIAFFVIVALVTLINQLLQLLKALGLC